MSITLEEYKKRLKKHNWHYDILNDNSWDDSSYMKYYNESTYLIETAFENGDDFKRAYNEAHKKAFYIKYEYPFPNVKMD